MAIWLNIAEAFGPKSITLVHMFTFSHTIIFVDTLLSVIYKMAVLKQFDYQSINNFKFRGFIIGVRLFVDRLSTKFPI